MVPSMSDENESKPAAPAPRVVEATHYREAKLLGTIEIMGSTKHGATNLMSVKDGDILKKGDTLKTKAWLLNAREFEVVRKHEKPMTLAGVWYEVRGVASAAKPPRR